VNGTDVTEPATGRFGMTVPVDSVESLGVLKTPFLGEYGRFTAGVVSVETRRGADKWHFELNDPFPEFRIRSGHLRGLRMRLPRVNFGGPNSRQPGVFRGRVRIPSRQKPGANSLFPLQRSKTESFNSFSQLDYIISSKHFLTGTVQDRAAKHGFANLSYFSPSGVAQFSSFGKLFTLTDHFALGATPAQQYSQYPALSSHGRSARRRPHGADACRRPRQLFSEGIAA